MSTVPGRDSLRDAGLVGVDPTEDQDRPELVELDEQGEDYSPEDPSPAQRPDVDPADVVDQAAALPEDGTDDYR